MRPSIENLINARIEATEEQRWQLEQRGQPAGEQTRQLDNMDSYLNGTGPLFHGLATSLANEASRHAQQARDTAREDQAAAEVLAEVGGTRWARAAATSARHSATWARAAATSARAFAAGNPAGTAAHAAADMAERAAQQAEQAAEATEDAATEAARAAMAAERSIA